MQCPECEIELPNGSKFCGKCGTKLEMAGELAAIDYAQPQSYTPKHLKDKILTSRSAIEG